MSKDSFSNEIITLIFPQLVNLNVLNRLDKNKQNLLIKKNFDFLLALLVIDGTDNSDFFLYKFNNSNDTKNLINFLKLNIINSKKKVFFQKKILIKFFILTKNHML